jgi:hypothetical protein
MDDHDAYIPQLPSIPVPAARHGLELELRRLNRARYTNNPISSVSHRIAEWSSKKALDSSARKLASLKTATDNCAAAIESMGELREAAMRSQVQQELTQLRHDFAVQRAISHLHLEFNQDREQLHIAQRAALTAHHGVEAAARFKEVNFRLGATRKEAQIAETADVLERPSGKEAPGNTGTIENLFRLRSELRADAKDTTAIDDAINAMAARLGLAAE